MAAPLQADFWVCNMGSPISPVLADLIMEVIEERAIRTAVHPPKWWSRYVDDSLACFKKDHVGAFHQDLISMNAIIQFTNGYGLPFLDTTTSRRSRQFKWMCTEGQTIQTVTLTFSLITPRARNIPSTSKGKHEETRQVKAVLRENNYPSSFVRECERARTTKSTKPTTNGGTLRASPKELVAY